MRKTMLLLFALLCGCMPPIVKERLDVIEDKVSCPTPATTLIVLLPGRYDSPRDFVQQGFIAELRRRRLAVDVAIADAHPGYYRERLSTERLHRDIILPARQNGYRKVWLAGISLGGFGSLLYAQRHGMLIDGMLVIAPYLGEDLLLQEIADAGGLAQWQPGALSADADGRLDGRMLWAWLQGYRTPQRPAHPDLYLGYGVDDRFAGSNSLLARILPQAQVMTTEGGHDWPPWLRLWQEFLDRGVLPRCAAS